MLVHQRVCGTSIPQNSCWVALARVCADGKQRKPIRIESQGGINAESRAQRLPCNLKSQVEMVQLKRTEGTFGAVTATFNQVPFLLTAEKI